MSVCNMHYKRLPLCQYQLLEALFRARTTPIQMPADSFHPVDYFFITLLFASLEQFFGDRSVNMPYVIKMTGFGPIFSDPFSNAFVSVGYNTEIASPANRMKSKHCFAPCTPIAWLLPASPYLAL